MVLDSSVYVTHVLLRSLTKLHYGKLQWGAVLGSRLARYRQVSMRIDRRFFDGSIRITDTVHWEARRVILRKTMQWKAANKLGPLQASKLRRVALGTLNAVKAPIRCKDDRSMRAIVGSVIADAWGDPGDPALREEWARKKGVDVTDGPPGGADLDILSTAAALARGGPVSLLTADNDFVVFRDPILRLLGVEVKDIWHLGDW